MTRRKLVDRSLFLLLMAAQLSRILSMKPGKCLLFLLRPFAFDNLSRSMHHVVLLAQLNMGKPDRMVSADIRKS
jgi:hypothetical protein